MSGRKGEPVASCQKCGKVKDYHSRSSPRSAKMQSWLPPLIAISLVLLLALRTTLAAHQQYQGDTCASDGSKCVLFKKCALAQGDLQDGKRPPLCGFEEAEPVVCCTTQLADRFGFNVNKTISEHMCTKYEEESCGNANNTERTNEPMTFMGMIGYGPRRNISWLCTGTLISRRYILSAAHCAVTSRGNATWVSLGHGDPKGKTIYTIKVNFPHFDYQPPKLYNDIALYRLDRVVEFGKYIRPICLPSLASSDLDFSRIAISAGWTPLSDKEFISFNDSIRLVPNYRCGLAGTPEELPNGPKENILCASQISPDTSCVKAKYGGILISPITPIPTDDSPQCYLEKQLGLLAVGQRCGIAEYPGVYMNLTHFQPWIESVVWPENSSYTEIIWNN